MEKQINVKETPWIGGNSGTYIPSNDGTEYWDTDRQTLQELMESFKNGTSGLKRNFEERQYLPEPDYRQIAAIEAGKIEHKSVQEYLSDCDKIYDWLMQEKVLKEKKRQELLTPKWKQK